METIEEQSKSEMSITPPPSPDKIRLCLVGNVINDNDCVEVAKTFGVPIITSETGLELIDDHEWRTFFILRDFENSTYEAIHKNKQCILGPPALKVAALKDGLIRNARPIYNYSMRGVITCFTGIRKKDELTKLVNLIHSMGGCIRKEMKNTKITHLICTHSDSDKYRYAKTFRLTVVRPAWVYAAWEHRDDVEFCAQSKDFSKEHEVKVFEGQKICFFGFPADEHEHMLDVLKSNGGIPAELDDPECSHVVMPNAGGYFTEAFQTNNISKIPNTDNNIQQLKDNNNIDDELKLVITSSPIPHTCNKMEVDNETIETDNQLDEGNNENDKNDRKNLNNNDDNDNDEDDDHFDERLVVDYERKSFNIPAINKTEGLDENAFKKSHFKKLDDIVNINSSTPKTSKVKDKGQKISNILLESDADSFKESYNMSLIFGPLASSPVVGVERNSIMAMETDDIDTGPDLDVLNDLKRKRESFDSVSLMSIDSFALPTSSKKPKLLRTGSITRTIKRSMSFVAEHTPIARILTRRSSAVVDSAPRTLNLDDSLYSIASIDTTMNESSRKPLKDAIRGFRKRFTKTTRKDMQTSSPDRCVNDSHADKEEFKTPKAPFKGSNVARTLSATKKALSTSSFRIRNQSILNLTNPDIPCTTDISIHSTTPTIVTETNTTNTTINANALRNQSNQVKLDNNNQCEQQHHIQHPHPANSNQDTKSSLSIPSGEKLKSEELDSEGHSRTVVDEHNVQVKPETKNHRTHILKSDWFWYTIQNGYADEMDYLFGDYLDSIANTPNHHDRRDSLPISFNKRKRKRFSQCLQLEGTPLGSGKRRSSISDAGLLSASGSFFDCTTSPDKLESGKLIVEPDTSTCEQTPKKVSMRFNHFMDFYSTESNYVGILDTIMNLFKNPLEEMADNNDALLNKSEIKAIFGNFLPIYEVHQCMLERLRAMHSKWSEDCLIGDIILQHRDDLIKAYPPYVNFFEKMKQTLNQCDTQNPRFHAFLKINQTKPECGRHSLQDLMIRPVQRLPSISLLLNDILKHTHKNNPDFGRLEEALKAIKEVMMHINEDKRKTESRMAIFDIFNDIENCPAHLVSSNRNFISRCEVNELSDNLSGRGDTLMLYLFSDNLEVCKKRSRGFNSAKSPGSTKCFKHVNLISLNAIRFVIDITDSSRAFAILCRQDKDKLYSFSIVDEEIDKVVYLKTLCKQMAENACRTDTDKALLCRTSQELEVDISDVNLSTLSKAFKLAARTRLKVGRAFSFNKTPSKLKRAVSTMMTSPFGSTNSLTPASQLAQMRLASCTNIHEVAQEDNCNSIRRDSPILECNEIHKSQLSLPTTRKNKTPTLNGMGRI